MEIFIIFSEIVFHTDIHAWNSIRRLTLSLHVCYTYRSNYQIYNRTILFISCTIINHRSVILKFSFSSTDFGIEWTFFLFNLHSPPPRQNLMKIRVVSWCLFDQRYTFQTSRTEQRNRKIGRGKEEGEGRRDRQDANETAWKRVIFYRQWWTSNGHNSWRISSSILWKIFPPRLIVEVG